MDVAAFSNGFTAIALLVLGLVAVYLASILVSKLRNQHVSETANLVVQIDQLLPQTQCRQCGYHGCRPYAEAINNGEAINRCPPGGEQTIKAIGELLGQPFRTLDPDLTPYPGLTVASIREAECIGCTKCIQACPVDAILGAPKLMHTVIAAECTGCDLCRDPCPVDCIDIEPVPDPLLTKPLNHSYEQDILEQAQNRGAS